MFDNLREQADSGTFYEDEAPLETAVETSAPQPSPVRRSGRFLGMTAIQRFILSVMLMMIVCILGSMFLLVAGKIVF